MDLDGGNRIFTCPVKGLRDLVIGAHRFDIRYRVEHCDENL